MTTEQILNFGFAFATVLVTVIIIILYKVSGKLKTGFIGPELNLLTYGSLWDTVSIAARHQPYWIHINAELLPFKILLLILISIANTVIMAWNFKLANRIETEYFQKNSQKVWLKIWSIFWGLIGIMTFFILKTFWE
jgi:hypothetical protein